MSTYGGRPEDQRRPYQPQYQPQNQPQYQQPPAAYASPQSYPSYQQPYQQSYPPAPAPATRSGGGAAGILAVIVGIAHAAWSVPFLLKLSDNAAELQGEDFKDWHMSWMIGSSIAQIGFGVLVLIGGFLLMAHRGSGRVLAGLSLVVLIGLNIVSLVIGNSAQEPEAKEIIGSKLIFMYNGVFWWFDYKLDGSEDFLSILDRNFTTQCVAFGALMLVSLIAMIAAFASKAGKTAAVAAPRYGY